MTRTSTPLRIVLGSGTRLGQTLVARRDAVEVVPVPTSSRPLERPDAAALLAATDGPVELVVCALGPVHPTEAPGRHDDEVFARDLAVVADVLEAAGDRRVSVVLVSTVIALAPGDDRRYYGGYKILAEARVRDLVAQHARHADLSVLYPGRLVDTSGGLRLHAPYARLARYAVAALGRSQARLVGLDARAWVLVRSLSLVVSLVRTGRIQTSPTSPQPLEHRTVA